MYIYTRPGYRRCASRELNITADVNAYQKKKKKTSALPK